jgi:hypothetical protein
MKFKSRQCKIAFKTNTEVIDKDITVVIDLISSLPLVTMDPDMLAKNVIPATDNTKVNATQLETSNTLYDPEYEDRFKLITAVVSPITSSPALLFFDAKYQDILITPCLHSFGNSLTNTMYKDRAVRLTGHRIGVKDISFNNLGNHNKDTRNNTIRGVYDDNTRVKFENAKSILTSASTSLHRISGLTAPSLGLDTQLYLGSDVGINLSYNSINVITLGNITDLFDGPVPIYNILQYSPSSFTLDYVGNQTEAPIHLLLNF